MNPTIHILLADDHQVIRTGLKTLLELQPDFKVVAEANDGAEAIALALEFHPEIVIMDITMPNMDGLSATRELKTRWPEAVILALTVHEDKFYFMEMLAAGATGYLVKQAASTELVQAIRTVAAGHVYLQPALARWLLDDYQRLASEKPAQPDGENAIDLDVLSEREREVLEWVAHGLNNAEIGARLELSPKTIARHRERIMAKLNLHSRTELVKFAIRTGLVNVK